MSLDASKLTIELTKTPTEPLPKEELVFGKTFTDHMVEVEWSVEEGWTAPKITPRHNFSFDPATVVFHYSFELFEGMKAYIDAEGNARTFRPIKNMERMNRSAKRAALPAFDGEELLKIMDQFLLVDKKFIPQGEGYSLYLRPTLIGTTVGLGVTKPTKALLYVIASPVGPYFGRDFKPISLEATEYAVRAWPKGYGEFKLGANYVSSIEPQTKAAARGHSQNLWLFGEEGYITEVGAMNVFFVLKNGDKKELVTPPLNGTILPGVTRDSTLQLTRKHLSSEEWIINEREITIHEVKEKAANGELLEVFGTGTAAIVSPVRNIEFREEHIQVPTGDKFGPLTQQIFDWIKAIQYGESEFEGWSRVAKKL